MTKLQLVLFEGNHTSREVVLTRKTTTLGRGIKNTIHLKHPSVSRQHAMILVNENRITIEDCDSSMGTLVNDLRIHPREGAELKDGDIVKMGAVVMIFKVKKAWNDKDSLVKDTIFASKANARVVLVEDGKIKRKFISGVETTFGSGAHCEVQFDNLIFPIEQFLIRVMNQSFTVENRGVSKKIMVNDHFLHRGEKMRLSSNSVISFHNVQILFLYDLHIIDPSFRDPIELLNRKDFLQHLSRCCDRPVKHLKNLLNDHKPFRQSVGEKLILEGVITPLTWKASLDRLISYNDSSQLEKT